MKNVATIFFPLAVLGFITSLVVHISAWGENPISLGFNPMILHGGIFLVFVPAIFLATRCLRGVAQEDSLPFLKRLLPAWTFPLIVAIFAYSFVNFFVAFFLKLGPTETATLRGFSGHWMIFYAVAAMLLRALRHGIPLAEAKVCTNGHLVAPNASFCGTCGGTVSAKIE